MRIGAFLIVAGCGAAAAPPPPRPIANTATPDRRSLSTAEPTTRILPSMPPAACDEPGLLRQDYDLDRDGIVDLRKLTLPVGGVLRCKLLDFDDDGRFDSALTYDPSEVAEYSDLDFNGRIDVMVRTDKRTGIRTTSRDLDGDGIADTVERGPASGQP